MHCSNGVEYIVNKFFLLGKESTRRVEMNFRKRPVIGGLEERDGYAYSMPSSGSGDPTR